MGLLYYPAPGEIVLCQYDEVARPAEMIKTRPVVVIGPRLRRRPNLVTIVPLSTTEPVPCEKHHCRIELVVPLPTPFDAPLMWAKCDMVTSVSRERLDRFKLPRARYGGARTWTTGKVDAEQLRRIRIALLCGLGFENLTKAL